MSAAGWITLAVGFVSAGGLGVLVGAILTHRRESKRDKDAGTIAYAESLRNRLSTVEDQVEGLWTARRADAQTIRAQGDFIDVLEAHIWQQKPPPPPARPPGI
jgi:hypothetical protein